MRHLFRYWYVIANVLQGDTRGVWHPFCTLKAPGAGNGAISAVSPGRQGFKVFWAVLHYMENG